MPSRNGEGPRAPVFRVLDRGVRGCGGSRGCSPHFASPTCKRRACFSCMCAAVTSLVPHGVNPIPSTGSAWGSEARRHPVAKYISGPCDRHNPRRGPRRWDARPHLPWLPRGRTSMIVTYQPHGSRGRTRHCPTTHMGGHWVDLIKQRKPTGRRRKRLVSNYIRKLLDNYTRNY